MNTEESNIICGRNSVLEALRSGRELDRLLIAHGVSGGSVTEITAKCRAKGVLIKEISPQKLDYYCGGANHQGVAVMLAAQRYSTVDDMLKLAEERNEKPFLIICDNLEDPHNLGAVIRTAEAAGAHGVIIPERRSASLNATVAKAACGAVEYVPVARVTSLANTIDLLKKRGLWIFGADMDGTDYTTTDFDTPCALVIGNEGKGMGTLITKKCDMVLSLPMLGKINSLNASVAAGILMYEVVRSRKKSGK